MTTGGAQASPFSHQPPIFRTRLAFGYTGRMSALRPPSTWREVPGAVRAALLAPFVKQADGLPVLSPIADVMGWRTDDNAINQNWGGPRPVTNLLIGAGLGSLGGYGAGRLAEAILPEKYFDPKAVRRRAALLGGALGALPAVYQGVDNVRNTGNFGSVFDKWPARKESVDVEWYKSALDVFAPTIHRSAFSQAVFGDENTPMPLRAATAGLVAAADAVHGDSDYVSPFGIATIAVGAGTGLVKGLVAGKALGVLAGLSPYGQEQLQRVGMWSGILNAVVPPALGLK